MEELLVKRKSSALLAFNLKVLHLLTGLSVSEFVKELDNRCVKVLVRLSGNLWLNFNGLASLFLEDLS